MYLFLGLFTNRLPKLIIVGVFKISLQQLVIKTLQSEYIIQHCSQHLVQNNELNCISVVFIKKTRTDISRSTSGGVFPQLP